MPHIHICLDCDDESWECHGKNCHYHTTLRCPKCCAVIEEMGKSKGQDTHKEAAKVLFGPDFNYAEAELKILASGHTPDEIIKSRQARAINFGALYRGRNPIISIDAECASPTGVSEELRRKLCCSFAVPPSAVNSRDSVNFLVQESRAHELNEQLKQNLRDLGFKQVSDDCWKWGARTSVDAKSRDRKRWRREKEGK